MDHTQIPQFLIAAPCSGSGKTTVSRGLMAALTRRGMRVSPFKCGPDYIDTKFHAATCGRGSVNLDAFMASPAHLRRLYAHYSAGADACVVEGMMGLFDGYSRHRGSSAEIAALLGLPVVLVVDAASAAYSTAALLNGFATFRPDTRIAGVIFNRTGSPRHCAMLREVCADLGLPCFGCLPKDGGLEQRSRYLGLDFSDGTAAAAEYLTERVEANIDIDLLMASTLRRLPEDADPFRRQRRDNLNITVLRNAEAFSFVYTEHLDILRRMGTVSFADPEADSPIPPSTDLLYLPGGYPEKHAAALAAATACRASVADYIAGGGRALAECGGMIYLSEGIHFDDAAEAVPMCGVLPFGISCMARHRRLSLGYRQLDYNGQRLRGHEFHYTQFLCDAGKPLPASAAQVKNAAGDDVATPLLRHANLLAGYTHLYWGETDLMQLFD